ncbi:hypothetical protein DFH06DRAFT_1312748 [Mycena polygramma]|nr:hypothetical protein DFH06DRAFT_1312748 [Mycena polygramma]
MSRRESRVSMNVRQNDALFEFETFKKKFLLANKHITKLNSTLSMKIEELNAEISTLYAENLRLRASEIALGAQLKREREKSRKILSDAEAATHALSSHFGLLRQTFNIPVLAPPSPADTPPRRLTSSPRTSTYANNPNVNRLAREPQVSNIHEDDEPEDVQASPPRKAKKKARLSASRLPLPARSSTPPIGPAAPAAPIISAPAPPPLHLDFATLQLPSKKRRQSGLLLDLGVVDIDAMDLDDADDVRENERQKEKEREKEKERKRRAREDGAASVKPKPKLKDVTNSNSPRPRSKAAAEPSPESPLTPLPLESQARTFLVPAPPSPPPPEPKALPVPPQIAVVHARPVVSQPPPQPVSSGSSSSLDSAPTDRDRDRDRERERRCVEEPTAETEAGGRERRTRKSVNYAEPKLNTKMRKPEPPAGSAPAPAPATKRARSSAAATVPVHASARRPSPPLRSARHEEPGPEVDEENGDEEDDEESDAWADGEYVPGWAGGHVNVEGRRRAPHGGRRKGEVGAVVGEWAREREMVREREGRRHSAAA